MGIGEDLASHLKERGWQVILTSHKVKKLARLLDMLSTIYTHRKEYSLAQVDVFSGPAFLWAYMSGGLLHLLQKPFVITLHGGNLPNFSTRHPVIVGRLFKWANAVTSPSTYLKANLEKFRSVIEIIPNGIQITGYPYRNRAVPQLNLIWLRAFHSIYNPSMAPHVVALLNDQGFDVHLTMVGPDKGDGSLQEMWKTASDLGINKQINVVPGVPKAEVPQMLAERDIFINTTNVDNTPVSVIEAMTCGLCIVSTNVGGIPYLLEDGVDALLVPQNDAQAMANAVQRIFTEEGLAEKLSANARKKAEQFDWSAILPLWEALFEKVIANE